MMKASVAGGRNAWDRRDKPKGRKREMDWGNMLRKGEEEVFVVV